MISILIPIYNGIEFIEDSVSSVINQTYMDWELIIAINGHQMGSNIFHIAKKYETDFRIPNNNKIKVYDFFHLKGKSETLNEMIKYCNPISEYVALLDVDDIWHPEKLRLQSNYLGYFDVIGSKCVYFGDMNNIIPDIPTEDISNFDFFRLNPIINSSAVIRKSLCKWVRNFEDADVEDYDLWLTLRRENKKFFNLNAISVKHRIHHSSAFNSKGNHNHVEELLNKHRKLLKTKTD